MLQKIEVTVAKVNLCLFYKAVAEINQKFEKGGYPTLKVTEHSELVTHDDICEKHDSEVFSYFTVESTFEGANLSNTHVHYAGVANFAEIYDQNSKVVSSDIPEVAKLLHDTKLTCDCCKKNITRGRYIAFLKDDAKVIDRDAVIILGRTCAKKYFPFDITHYFYNLDVVLEDLLLEYSDEESHNRYRQDFIPMDEVAEITQIVTNNLSCYMKEGETKNDFFMYKSNEKSKDGTYFRDRYNNVTTTHTVAQMLDAVKTVYGNPQNEFEQNIFSVMLKKTDDGEIVAREDVNVKYLGIAIYSLYGAEKELKKRIEKEAELKKDAVSEYVGTEGERITAKLSYTKTISFRSDWDDGFIYYHFFKDEKGNVYKWSTSIGTYKIHLKGVNKNGREIDDDFYFDYEVGKEYLIKGTIKAHSEYKGVKQNVLTRCKILDDFIERDLK